jgi:hypothetical protein
VTQFKKGDKVVCIDAKCSGGLFVEGREYEVRGHNLGDIYLDGVTSSWMSSRFKLAEPQTKPSTTTKPAWEPLGPINGVLTARLVVPGGTFYHIAGQTHLILDRDAA